MAASKQANIHTHMRNAVPLVWGSLRLAPIITCSMNNVEDTIASNDSCDGGLGTRLKVGRMGVSQAEL